MSLNKLNIRDINSGLVEKKFSATEVLEDCLAVIKSKDKELNSFVLVTEEEARVQAKVVDDKIAGGEKIGALEGVPAGLKDIFNTKGIQTTCCSKFLKGFKPPYNATVVERLNSAGMVMVGKLNMDEFACGGSTEHSCFGVTKNPHDLERVAGGSSGGSAAALASDMCVYSMGTDTGGSVRQPASFCGVYGMKPTYGRVSRSGVTAMASSWDVVGPFTRTVEDMAYVMNVIAGKDKYDSTTLDVEVPDYLGFLGGDVKGLKVGLPKEYFGEGVDDETCEVVKKAASKLEAMGAEIINVSLSKTKYAVAVYYVTMPAELSANLERFDGIRYGVPTSQEYSDTVDYYYKTRGEGFGDEIKRRIMIGTYVLSAGYYDAYYKKGQQVRTLIIEDFDNAFKKVDVLLTPVSPFPAFKVGELADNPLAMYMADALTIPASAAGLPAMSCPFGTSKNGLPIGVQIIAPHWQEGRIMNVAKALESF
ncbi:Asp-tRNA(Asn)/Glu-tRNA(Gln) amidotransferase GatCAB subunit A [Candidatus Peregrinibacteria bacterium HGW-Peregrinibacteria-1]|jgi:aspartyl-tRNA(Asn)/glutamyl-tRNA(Gln) amidotransferase subunit A|nr:MAG: Asp-tRNA(Asn)/Glu-tRNA(Gln) amidotransferase GatCAB subunit A [Candidatus Peregrinibacteria bacterium HGW-Peregrinibacteria-1]